MTKSEATDAPNPRQRLSTALAEGGRILRLGQALSNTSTALLAERWNDNFLLGTISPPSDGGPVLHSLSQADGYSDQPDAGLLAAVLKVREQAGAAVLLRAPQLAAWGLSGRALPVRYFQMFSYTRAKEIPVSAPNPVSIATTLERHPDAPALLLSDGRSLIWAPQSARAIRLVLSLEEAANVTSLADALGGAQDYPAEAREKIYLSLQAQARR